MANEDSKSGPGARAGSGSAEPDYRVLIDNSRDAVYVRVGERIIYANPATLRLLRAADAAQILGHSPLEFVHPQDRETVRARMQRGSVTGLFNPPNEQIWLRFDGSPIEVEATSVPIEWENGRAVQVVLRDIGTKRKAEAWIQGLVDSTQDALISIDKNACIDIFNPAAERMFGYTRGEIQGKKVNVLMAEPYATEHDSYLARYEETGERRAIGRIRTVAGRRKSGDVFPVELSVTEIRTGRETSYAAFIRDVSEKISVQSQLAEAEKLAAVGVSAAKLAHEVGNPLNGLYLTAQLLRQNIARHGVLSDKTVSSKLNTMLDEIRRLNNLLEEFRFVYRRDALELEPVSLLDLTTEVIGLEKPLYITKGIHTILEIPVDLPVIVADADKLKQVVLNLCRNAVDAMPDGGTLELSAARDAFGICLEVADSGIGVPPGLDIWEPFTTSKKRGTGLGLAIVKRIVAAHHGSISYRSHVGTGTRFIVRLPQSPAEAADC